MIFQLLHNGTYFVTLIAIGYNNCEADNVAVKLGEINTLIVELLK